MLRALLAGAVTVLTVLIAVACGGGDSPTSTVAQEGSGGSEVPAVPTSTVAQDSSSGYDLTESKHTAYCRELRSAVGESADEPMTWGEVAQRSDGALDRIEDITAPEELKDYHSALIAVIKANIDFYGRQDSSEPFNPELGPQDDEVVALVAVSRALDREIASQMLDEGCSL